MFLTTSLLPWSLGDLPSVRERSQAVCKRAALLLWSCHRQLDLSNSLGDLNPFQMLIPRPLPARQWNTHVQDMAGVSNCCWAPSWNKELLPLDWTDSHWPRPWPDMWLCCCCCLAEKSWYCPKVPLYPSFPTRQPWLLMHQCWGAGNSRKQKQPYLELLLAEEDL